MNKVILSIFISMLFFGCATKKDVEVIITEQVIPVIYDTSKKNATLNEKSMEEVKTNLRYIQKLQQQNYLIGSRLKGLKNDVTYQAQLSRMQQINTMRKQERILAMLLNSLDIKNEVQMKYLKYMSTQDEKYNKEYRESFNIARLIADERDRSLTKEISFLSEKMDTSSGEIRNSLNDAKKAHKMELIIIQKEQAKVREDYKNFKSEPNVTNIYIEKVEQNITDSTNAQNTLIKVN